MAFFQNSQMLSSMAFKGVRLDAVRNAGETFSKNIRENVSDIATEAATHLGNSCEASKSLVCLGTGGIVVANSMVMLQKIQQRYDRIKEIDNDLKHLDEKIAKENNKLNAAGKQDFTHERNNENFKVIVCIGKTGEGKSTFCNRMLGDTSENGDKGVSLSVIDNDTQREESICFKTSIDDEADSCTDKIEKHSVYHDQNWNATFADNFEKIIINDKNRYYSIVDTPGAFDTNGTDNDITNSNKLGQVFGQCGGINMFCIVLQVTNIRVDNVFVKLLKQYQRFYCPISNDNINNHHDDEKNINTQDHDQKESELEEKEDGKLSKNDSAIVSDFWDHVLDKNSKQIEKFPKNKLSFEGALKKKLGIEQNRELKIFAIGINNYEKTRNDIVNLLFDDKNPHNVFCRKFISKSIDTPIVQWRNKKKKLEEEKQQ